VPCGSIKKCGPGAAGSDGVNAVKPGVKQRPGQKRAKKKTLPTLRSGGFFFYPG